MDLRHLRYFLAVAEELNFRRAAERLSMAQPPLSRQIADLERDLGVQLFVRTRRQVSLTEAGKVLVDEARATLEQAERAVDATRRAARGESGRVVVGYIPSSIHGVLRPVIQAFREAYPSVELLLRELMTAEQVAALRAGHIDVAFLHLPVDDYGSLSILPVCTESLLAALPRGHRLARHRQLSWSTLAGETLLLPAAEREPQLYTAIARGSKSGLGLFRIRAEGPNLLAILGLVGCAAGISIVPESVATLSTEDVVYRRLIPPAVIQTAAVWQTSSTSIPLRNFIDTVRQLALNVLVPVDRDPMILD